ncbi:putative phosphatase [Streptomyces sp. RB5]|uniref:Putative phosphatase n=1 Tax=Streptomyces smaragdinus TaxID=2585196 RepID=A0A7K0CK32_9ACTN|nr:phosphatase [Streptomyces smaragdinus]MQY13865.1 putative phosphatase [Streptomyces smaragdinus]
MSTASTVPSRAELIDHLVRTRIAGDVATTRDHNLHNYRELAAGNPRYLLGLDVNERWTKEQVLELMATRVGVNPDPGHTTGADTIDVELVVDGLDRMATVLRKAADTRRRVLVATGHPGGLLDVHRALSAALVAAGCPLVSVPEGLWVTDTSDESSGRVQQFCGVAVLERGATLWHTHAPEPMWAILDALPADGWPELVVADHGWAGGAGYRGIDTVGFADSNDPALFLGEAEGTLQVAVPMDDHVADSRHYEPMTAYLLAAAGL